jgi:DNA-binding GntR family transcriptional regulator
MQKRPRSITEHVYNELRAELISCKLRPGERLRTNDLAVRFSVSLSGVREALSRLVSEYLVVSDPQRGFRASPVSAEDLRSLSETAMGIEAMCIRSALENGDADWEARLAVARDAVMAAPLTDEDRPGRIGETFATAHADFHSTLMSACSNAWMLHLRGMLGNQSERYRQLCIPLTPNIALLKQGYAEITDAAISRDVARTVALVEEQFHRNVSRFVEALESDEALRYWSDT